MTVRRIVANIATKDIAAAKRFYQDVLGLGILMDQGWIATYGSEERMQVQVSFMAQGGSDTPVPDLSIEVDDVDAALLCARSVRQAGEYPVASLGVSTGLLRDVGGTAPPSGLPAISPARGEISSFGAEPFLQRSRLAKAVAIANLPLAGEMPGRAEGV